MSNFFLVLTFVMAKGYIAIETNQAFQSEALCVKAAHTMLAKPASLEKLERMEVKHVEIDCIKRQDV